MKAVAIEDFVPNCVRWVRYVEKTKQTILITKDEKVWVEVRPVKPTKKTRVRSVR
jgi:gamma-glutamyl:cysteine ligase YbdK (ATP-grasp superfamily)